MTRDPARRGVRPLATAAATITTTLLATTLRDDAGLWPGPAAAVALLLVVAGFWRLRAERASPLGTTAVVVGASLAGLSVRAWLDPRGADLDLLLAVLGTAFAVAGLLRNDRRLVLLGFGQWLVATARPLPGGPTYRHCLLATDLAIPLARLGPSLALGAAALTVGLALRTAGRQRDGARGFELAGLSTILTVLVLRAVELPGLPLLCGAGDALDAGWAALALASGLLAAGFGVATRDAAWATAGLLTVLATGSFGSLLTQSPAWALVAALPIVGALAALERGGTRWPHHLGYVRAWPGGSLLPFDDPAEPAGVVAPPVGTPDAVLTAAGDTPNHGDAAGPTGSDTP